MQGLSPQETYLKLAIKMQDSLVVCDFSGLDFRSITLDIIADLRLERVQFFEGGFKVSNERFWLECFLGVSLLYAQLSVTQGLDKVGDVEFALEVFAMQQARELGIERVEARWHGHVLQHLSNRVCRRPSEGGRYMALRHVCASAGGSR